VNAFQPSKRHCTHDTAHWCRTDANGEALELIVSTLQADTTRHHGFHGAHAACNGRRKQKRKPSSVKKADPIPLPLTDICFRVFVLVVVCSK
jgi:hypothetical protein